MTDMLLSFRRSALLAGLPTVLAMLSLSHERFPGRFGRRDFPSHGQKSLVHWRTTKQIAFTENFDAVI